MVPQPEPTSEDATLLMLAAAAGDRAAADRLLPLVYEQLRRAAQRELSNERSGHSLSATALVHEAYLKLAGPREIPWANRGHFYAAAARAIRQILLDHARSRARGGIEKRPLESIGDVASLISANVEQIMAVDAALVRLETEDPEAAALVQLRFYAGLGVEQAADVMGISPRTAARMWNYARVVLYRRLSDGS